MTPSFQGNQRLASPDEPKARARSDLGEEKECLENLSYVQEIGEWKGTRDGGSATNQKARRTQLQESSMFARCISRSAQSRADWCYIQTICLSSSPLHRLA